MSAPNGDNAGRTLPSPRTPSVWPPPRPVAGRGRQSSVAGSAVSSARGGGRIVTAVPGAAAHLPPGVASRRGLRSLAAKLSRLLGDARHTHAPLPPPDVSITPSPEENTITLRATTLAKFDQDEINVLKKIYKELNLRSSSEGIDKETFQEYFPLPGLWGERLFHKFDSKKCGRIDYEALMDGLAICCRGTKLEKIQVLFDMFDLDGDGLISREELTFLLSNVPRLENYLPGRMGTSQTNSKATLETAPGPTLLSALAPGTGFPDMDSLFWVSGYKSTSSSSLASRDLWDREDAASRARGINLNARNGFCSATSWRTSLSGGELSPRGQDLRGPGDVEDEDEKYLYGAGPSPMVAELLAKAQSEELGPSSMVDLEGIVDHILEDYDTLDRNALSFSGFKSFLEHYPRFLQLFSDSLREDIWALQGHALYRSQRAAASFSPALGGAHPRPPTTGDGFDSVSGAPLGQQSVSIHGKEGDSVKMDQLETWIRVQQLFTGQAAPKQMIYSPPSTIPLSKTPGSKTPSPANAEGHDSPSSNENPKSPQSMRPIPLETGVYPRHSRYSGSREVLDFLEVSLGQYASDEDDEWQAFDAIKGTDARSNLEFRAGDALVDNRKSIWQDKQTPLSCPHCHAPLLVCPRCDRRCPVLRFHNSQLFVECQGCTDTKPREFANCWVCQWSFSKALDMIDQHNVAMEGKLYKVGKHTKTLVDRYYVLVDKLLYYYRTETDSVPKGFVFLEGCYVDPISTESIFTEMQTDSGVQDESRHERLFGFCIVHGGGNFSRRELFAKDEAMRDRWLSALRAALNQQPVDKLFQMEEIIGQGKFSVVYRAIEKATNETYAVKVINKARMSSHEKELLRGEMSIMRLLRHPHVIYLKSLVATRDILHIVMELVPGGELFDAIAHKGSLSETTVNRLTCQLLKTLIYLHKAGIVHRDLKPENLLLTDKDVEKADVKIADFGLSCLCGPNEKLYQPCGTLVYVAPEVLTLQGYSHPVDLWSLGVIVYLLLAGRLPFPIMRNSGMSILTEREKFYRPKFDSPVWKSVSRSAQDFISHLLDLDVHKRFTATEASNHIWIKNPSAVLKGVTPKPVEATVGAPVSARRKESLEAPDIVIVDNIEPSTMSLEELRARGVDEVRKSDSVEESTSKSRLWVRTHSDASESKTAILVEDKDNTDRMYIANEARDVIQSLDDEKVPTQMSQSGIPPPVLSSEQSQRGDLGFTHRPEVIANGKTSAAGARNSRMSVPCPTADAEEHLPRTKGLPTSKAVSELVAKSSSPPRLAQCSAVRHPSKQFTP